MRYFLKVPHLLGHGASVYNGHLRGPMTPECTFCRDLGCEAVTTFFYDLALSWLGSNTQPSACGANALTHCTTVVAPYYDNFIQPVLSDGILHISPLLQLVEKNVNLCIYFL